jgi:hypothetical protein
MCRMSWFQCRNIFWSSGCHLLLLIKNFLFTAISIQVFYEIASTIKSYDIDTWVKIIELYIGVLWSCFIGIWNVPELSSVLFIVLTYNICIFFCQVSLFSNVFTIWKISSPNIYRWLPLIPFTPSWSSAHSESLGWTYNIVNSWSPLFTISSSRCLRCSNWVCY